jgi:hypothetical protein
MVDSRPRSVQNMGPMTVMPPPSRFLETLLGKEVYVKLAKDWSVQGRLNRIEEAGLVLERVGIPPVFVRFERIGTIEEAQ